MPRKSYSQFYKKLMVMKDDKLHKAISELPIFEAPDVWIEIEKSLPRDNDIKMFWLGFIIVFVCGTLLMLSTNILSENAKTLNSISKLKVSQRVDMPSDSTIENNLSVSENIDSQNLIYSDLISEQSQVDYENQEIYTLLEQMIDNSEEVAKIKSGFFGLKTSVVFSEIGENLVNNPSFEDFNVCPKGIVGKPERKLIPFWDVPSKGTPDYFNSCSKEDAGVPENFAGKIYAHSGYGYCGLILRQNFTNDNKITGEKPVIYREYVQTELKSELVKGKKYKIKFWICNSSKSRFAVDAIGACITSEKIKSNDKELMNFIPVVENSVGKYLVNKDYWVAVEGIYEAKGGEKYLTIGNFNNNFSTNYIMQNGASDFNYAYYYLDDVSVFMVEESLQTALIEEKDSVKENTFMAEF